MRARHNQFDPFFVLSVFLGFLFYINFFSCLAFNSLHKCERGVEAIGFSFVQLCRVVEIWSGV